MTALRLHHTAHDVTVLGPGKRYVLWTQGCPRRCPGCIAPDAQPLDGGEEVSVTAAAERILRASGQEGLTISGGEPFLQAGALTELIDRVRAERDLGVIAYTGYVLEELRALQDEEVDALLSRIDLLIDGPYIQEQNDDGGLRGSSNQRAIHLTDRYLSALTSFGEARSRSLEYRVNEDGFFLVGIPTRAALRLIRGES